MTDLTRTAETDAQRILPNGVGVSDGPLVDPTEIKATTGDEQSDPKSLPNSVWIKNTPFMRDLNRLKELRSFLIKEAATLNDKENQFLSFGRLNLLRESYGIGGRQPSENEWYELEARQKQLFSHLDANLRKKYLLGNIPSWIAYLPAVFGVIAVLSIYSVYLLGIASIGLASYLVWLTCLGIIGSVAFIGMNVLSVQDDVTFDLNNSRLMALRIVLGGMFALVLSLPFGYQHYQRFVLGLGSSQSDSQDMPTQAAFLLLPFILGFSTSLVIMILNRLIEAVKTFFGHGATSSGVAGASCQVPSGCRRV